MRILFIAPRYHTNQIPITKGLIENGHEVVFIVQAKGGTENYSALVPKEMKLSLTGKIVSAVLKKKYDRPTYETKMTVYTIPSYSWIKKAIKEINPDLVILRDRDFATMIAYKACKKLGIKNVVLYNQTGVYSNRTKPDSFSKRFIFKRCPQVRYTISKINDINEYKNHKEDLYIREHDYFVPYVAPINEEAKNRSYLKDGKLNILCTGKYRKYKNHYVFVRAIEELKNRGKIKDINFTILGQSKVPEEEAYFEKLKAYIEEKGLSDLIELRKNAPYSEMKNIYMNNDVFLLSSFAELASISILEAMSNGTVPISSSYNGTACYITEGENGFIFETDDEKSLADVIEYISDNRDKVAQWGKNAFDYVDKNCRYENHRVALSALTEKEFGLKI